MHSIELQGLFDLSYDPFDKFKEKEVRRSLKQGADISNLNTAKFPKATFESTLTTSNRHISQQVKDLVWKRDNGNFDSNELLEFDPITPFSKGGSNTPRAGRSPSFGFPPNLDRMASVKELTSQMGINSQKLPELFTQHFGMGRCEYFQNLRMNKAAQLLIDKEFTITEVGNSLGCTP